MTTLSARTVVLWSLILILAWLAGCAPVPIARDELPAGRRLGTLRVMGSNVLRNQHRAVEGEPVYDGDTISTGPGSSAWIELGGGEFIQLDENTDPLFSLKIVRIDNNRECIHLYINFGRVWVDSPLVCIETLGGEVLSYSVVNIEVTPRSTTVTVFSGRAQVVRPAQQLLEARQQVTITRDRIRPVRVLNDQELEEVARWRERSARPRPDRRSEEERCLEELNAFIASRRLRPDRETSAKAQSYCARGDLRSAIDVIKKGK